MTKFLVLIAIGFILGCTPTEEISQQPEEPAREYPPERPIPYPVDLPSGLEEAFENQTRTPEGRPGEDYWQQYAEYDLTAELKPEEKQLAGTANIRYHNNSPDDLGMLLLDLTQNHHAKGVQRNLDAEITGGIELHEVIVQGDTLTPGSDRGNYQVDNTRLRLRPEEPLLSGEETELTIKYSFDIPQQGAGGRMGHTDDNVFYIGYWYPQMTVYDDVLGWHPDFYLGMAEFYHGFAEYDLSISAPEQWLIHATGELQNPGEVLTEEIYERARQAWQSDTTYQIVGTEDFGEFTRSGGDTGTLTWHFRAEDVRDVAFSATSESIWDGARTTVEDPETGEPRSVKINTVYREEAELWQDVTEYQQHAISFLSEFTGFAYPWPHMTAVEGQGIIGGGMEYPMMTVMGSYSNRGANALYNVTAHELAHMWIPLILSTDERRYGWLDEGNTVFSTNEARDDFGLRSNHTLTRQQYLRYARLNEEIPIMRRSNYHYTYPSYISASYNKPATVLQMLRGLLGEEIFEEAYQTFIDRWAFKHPTPWDMFHTFEDVSGRDLEWFWRTWYYEGWLVDQVIENVEAEGDETRITVKDQGRAPMPVLLRVTTNNGERTDYRIDVDTWLAGNREASKIVPHSMDEIQRVVIDADRYFPLISRSDARWEAEDAE